MKKKYYKIGEIAARLDISPRTLRFYEEQQLIIPDMKSDGGYRLYSEESVDKISFIRTLRNLGLSVHEIKKILDAKLEGDSAFQRQQKILKILQDFLLETKKKIELLSKVASDIEDAIDLLSDCECTKLPNWESCTKCKTMINSGTMPDVLKAILK